MAQTSTLLSSGRIADTAARRDVVFRERPSELLQRYVYGTAWDLKTYGLAGLAGTAYVLARDALARSELLPDPENALDHPWGLAGLVVDFSPETILKAYRRSLFPWAHLPPLKWWSLPERMVLKPSQFRIAKRLRRTIRKSPYTVTFDTDFVGVLNACSQSRHGGRYLTWLTPRIKRAFLDLHDAGHAHSFEVWDDDGALIGGGYGLAIGGVFHTESQFSRKTDTSKIGFTVFNHHLAQMDFALNDGKWYTSTIDAQGFRKISRAEFMAVLDAHGDRNIPVGRWHGVTDLQVIKDWQPEPLESAPSC